MDEQPPLLIAAISGRGLLSNQWRDDAWPALCRIYAGAVMQLRFLAPQDKITLETLPDNLLNPQASDRLEAHGIVEKLFDEITADNDAERLSSLARSIIEHLGHYVYQRISFLILAADHTDENSLDDHFLATGILGEIGGDLYRLVPTFLSSGRGPDQEPLIHHLTARLPADGWVAQQQKILPRFVRVINGPAVERIKVRYLEVIDQEANRRLADLYSTHGLVLAALPLHPDMKMKVNELGKVADGMRFRLIQPPKDAPPEDQWPEGWEDHLWRSLEKCIEHKVAVAVLPELMGAPDVVVCIKTYIKEHKADYPALIATGSWHTGNGDGFYNRLNIFSINGGNLTPVCTHDKFAPFVFEGYVEGNKKGKGYTWLVTAVGGIVLGICRDWFFSVQVGNGSESRKQIERMAPTMALAPSMTTEARDLYSYMTSDFNRFGTSLLFSNACGQVRLLKGGKCCAVMPEKSDARSFLASPDWRFEIATIHGAKPEDLRSVHIVQANCKNNKTKDNIVVASIRLSSLETTRS